MEAVIVRKGSLGILDQVNIDCTEKISLTLCQPASQFQRKGSALKGLIIFESKDSTVGIGLQPLKIVILVSEHVISIRDHCNNACLGVTMKMQWSQMLINVFRIENGIIISQGIFLN